MNATTTGREHRNDRQIINKENPTGGHKEGIKRSQRDILFVSYEEQEDDLYDLDHPKRSRYVVNRLLGQC